jgi:hypothetical protein
MDDLSTSTPKNNRDLYFADPGEVAVAHIGL